MTYNINMRILVFISFLLTFQNLYAKSKLNNEFQLLVENDSVMRTDRYYTSGVKFLYKRTLGQWSDSRLRFRLGYIQEIYTPEDLESEEAVDDDHPYTGLQYGLIGLSYSGSSLYFRADAWYGVQGPSSRADEIQNFIHRVTASESPNGWKYQTSGQHFWNGSFMLLLRNRGDFLEFSPWLKYKTGNLRDEMEPGVKLGIRALGMEIFTDFSVIYVKYNAILQGPKGGESPYVISSDNMNEKYYKADAGVFFRFERFGLLYKTTWLGPQFKKEKSHLYSTFGLSLYW